MTGQMQPEPSVEVLTNLGRLGLENLQRFLDSNAGLVTPTSVEQLGELVRQRVRVDVEEALGLAEAAIEIASRLSDGVSLGRSFRAKANALWFKGNCKAAVDLFEKAISEFEMAGLSAEVGRTLSSSIQTLVLLGEYERAGAAAGKARKIFSDLGDDWRRARLELNAANIDHRQDRFAEALARYEEAYEELLRYKDAEGSGVALHNMAVCLIMLNDFDRALGCYQRVRELCQKSGMPLLELQADYNIAYLYFLRGDYKTAIAGLHRTREQCRSNGDAYHAALCNLDEAEIYLELNLIDEAARLADEARHQFEELGMAFETGRSTANLAIANHRQANSKRALELFTEARAIFARESNEAWLALIDLYQAMVKFELGSYEDSRSLCTRAREFFRAAALDRREIICELLLVRLSLAVGDVCNARAECEPVLQKLDGLNAPLLGFQAQLLLGHIERSSGPSAPAHQAYERARSALETLRSTVQSEELKVSFLKDKIDLYESLIQVSLELNSDTAAASVLQYIQQAKSRSLAELVYGQTTELGWNAATGAQAQRVRELRGELNWLSRRIAIEQTAGDGFSVERINRLRGEARCKEDELVRAVRDIEATSGKSGIPDAAIPMEAAEIQSSLDPDVTLIEYFLISDEFLAVVMDKGAAHVVRLASLDRVRSRLRMLEFQLSKFRLDKAYSSDFEGALLGAAQNHLSGLYKDLVAPLAPLIRGRHLVLAPHGMLHYIPFHALLDGSEYLIDRFTISFAPSASIYAMCQKKPGNGDGPSLLMGVHDDNAPWIEQEISSVATVVPKPQVFLGEKATSDVLRSVGPSSRLIHIATHGLFRKDNPMFSSICLADLHMSLYDLYELRLPVELVTMSGCGTGLSVVAAGDELLGLARGVLSAGAQAILLSLWDVHDRTTAELMTSFYSCLAQGKDKASALRTAMIETRARHPHPYFWAPFVLIGKAFESSN